MEHPCRAVLRLRRESPARLVPIGERTASSAGETFGADQANLGCDTTSGV
jgi:hypothetical protein